MPLPPPPTGLLGDVVYQDIMVAAQALLVEDVVGAIHSVTSKTAKTVVAFAQGVRQGVQGIGPEMLKAHRQIAKEAQEAIVNAYVESLLGTPTYRTDPIHEQNRRYAGGILEGLLRESDFCTYDEKGVYIGNTAKLDAGARQWRRLNYGAGGAAGTGARIFSVRWSNLDLFVLEEPGAARPGFRIPGGRWIGDEFYPLSELTGRDRRRGRYQQPRETRGIRGTHWLAAGLEVVAKTIPDAYSDIFKRLYQQGDEQARRELVGDTGLRRPGTPRTSVTNTGGEEL